MIARIAKATLIACGVIAALAGNAQALKSYQHHRITVAIDTAANSIDATVRIRLHTTSSTLVFDLDPRLNVESVHLGDTRLRFAGENGTWRVELPASGEQSLSIHYGGPLRLAQSSAPRSRSFVETDGTLLVGAWHPHMTDDPITYDVDASIDQGQTLVIPGRVVEQRQSPGANRIRVESERSLPEIALFAGPFQSAEIVRDGVTVRTYLHSEGARFANTYLEKSAAYLRHYDTSIGAYPFSHFYVVSSPMPVGYGFAGVAYLSRKIIPLPYVPLTSLGHEVLHNWWGIGVRVAPGSGNWAEGLTTFQSDYAFAEQQSGAKGLEMRLRWLRQYAVLPAERDFALAEFHARAHTASQVVGYHKAAYVFLMLRDIVGDEGFSAALRDFWKTHDQGSAGWGDIERSFRRHSNRPLNGFFRQWIDRTGAPSLAIHDTQVTPTESGFRTVVTLSQSVPDGGAAYRLDVPIEIESDSSRSVRSYAMKRALQSFSIDTQDRPEQLRVDPDLRLFRRLSQAEVPAILREVAFDTKAATLIAFDDDDGRAAAADLAKAFLERAPRYVDRERAASEPVLLVVGEPAKIPALVQGLGLAEAPAPLATGTARAWATKLPSGGAVAIVEGDAAALRRIAGPLPHYGSQSFVVFDGRRAVDRGLWPVTAGPLHVDLRNRN